MDTRQTLALLSSRLGRDPALIQGGGGNTSLKEGDHMWIKASGVTLAHVTADNGFVAVDPKKIAAGLEKASTESDYTALIKSAFRADLSPDRRPSIETGFHALLDRAVLHSHSVWANLLCCATTGEASVARLFPDALWIPYAAPGLPLMKAIEKAVKTRAKTTVLFLQNHGMIVSAPTLDAAWTIHEQSDAAIRDAFALSPQAFADFSDLCAADDTHVLFPDQAVYLTRAELAATPAGQQTLKAYAFIRKTLENRDLSPHYLAAQDVAFLLAMEAETYRQKCAQQGV